MHEGAEMFPGKTCELCDKQAECCGVESIEVPPRPLTLWQRLTGQKMRWREYVAGCTHYYCLQHRPVGILEPIKG